MTSPVATTNTTSWMSTKHRKAFTYVRVMVLVLLAALLVVMLLEPPNSRSNDRHFSLFCQAFIQTTLPRKSSMTSFRSIRFSKTTSLDMAKKKSSNVATTTTHPSSGNNNKIQVRLLKHVAGTGQAGDIIQVNPAFYNNKLRAQKLAERISDDQLQALQEKEQKQYEAKMKSVQYLQETLSHDMSDFVLRFSNNKTGPDGKKLFGGINAKKLLQQLHSVVDHELLHEKQVKVMEITQDGKKLRGDIKETGEYQMKLQLWKDEWVKISVVVE